MPETSPSTVIGCRRSRHFATSEVRLKHSNSSYKIVVHVLVLFRFVVVYPERDVARGRLFLNDACGDVSSEEEGQ